jgi:hypothetical protein
MYNNAQNIELCVDTTYPIFGTPYNLSSAFACEILPLGGIPNPCCLYQNTNDTTRCGESEENCLKWSLDYLQWGKPGLARPFFFMALQFIVQFGIVLIYEAGFLRWFSYKVNSLFKRREQGPASPINHDQLHEEQQLGDIIKDSDVLEEERRIDELVRGGSVAPNAKEIFIVNRLTKYYANFMAVKGVSFSMAASETFGLLGVNGAGKTTTFKMITGDEFITRGDAFLNKTSLKNNIKTVIVYVVFKMLSLKVFQFF